MKLTANRPDGLEYERGKGRRLLAEALDERGIAHFSVAGALARHRPVERIYYRHDGHLTPLGNRIVAGAIRRFLIQRDWVPNAVVGTAHDPAGSLSANGAAVPRRAQDAAIKRP